MQTLPGLHIMLLILCALIFAGVVAVMFWSIFAHRRMKHHATPHFHKRTTVEVIWTIVPIVIVLLMALPAARAILMMKNPASADITVRVTYQRQHSCPRCYPESDLQMWHYEYVTGEGTGIDFLSIPNHLNGDIDHPLVVPVDRKIRLIISDRKTQRLWSMPTFDVKHDAVAGFTRDAWFKAERVGTYQGSYTQQSDASSPPSVVQVLSAHDYTQWVAAQRKTPWKNSVTPDE